MKLESEVMSNYLQKTAINHATSINSGSRQQSKQKFNLKLQECYGKNQKQALIALTQNQKRLPSNNMGSVFSSTKPSEAIVGDYSLVNEQLAYVPNAVLDLEGEDARAAHDETVEMLRGLDDVEEVFTNASA